MIMQNIESNVENYFKDPLLKELIEQLKKKYQQYGSCVGTIFVKPKTEEEALKISKFLSRNIKINDKTKIKITDIQKALNDSAFAGITVENLVLLLFPNLKSNKQIKIEKENFIEEIVRQYHKKYQDTVIISLFENEEAMKKIKSLLLKERDLLETIFTSLLDLPYYKDMNEYLALFASNTTGNPHYYDLDTHASNVLIQFISYLFHLSYENNRTVKKQILQQAGILTDEVSNYVITYNLSGNELLDGFKKNLTPLIISLPNLVKMDNIETENDTLLIVENPSFISKINDKNLAFSVLITSGNSNFIVYKLLEKMKVSHIYFNGDFDPEGLLIAQNLKNKFLAIQFIGYTLEYYQNGYSKNSINETRLKKLNSVTDKYLCVMKDLLLKNKVSSYQEASYDKLLEDMNKIVIENKK